MKQLLPGRVELAVLVVLALLCAAIVDLSPSHDVALGLLGAPVFLIAALMGLRRSGALSALPVEEEDEANLG